LASVAKKCPETQVALEAILNDYPATGLARPEIESFAGKRIEIVNRPVCWLRVFICLVAVFASQTQFRRAMADESSLFEPGLARIDIDDLKRHVATLASDSLEGREAGSRGGKAASAYLRSVLRSLRESHRLPLEMTQEFGRDYQNLLVVIPGSDPALQHEVVVVGAHFDHVGFGKASNSRGPIGHIHNGADDNASGTSALLELIEAFSSLERRPARSLLFAFWDAEETGLLGSKHWVTHPTIPLSEIRFVLNMDMLGRLREGRVITVGWRSAPGLRSLLALNNPRNKLLLAFQPTVIADSDHHPFYAAGIPVIHLDTDKHDDYHRPSDDPDKINLEGLRQMTEFSYRIVFEAANRPDFPRFRQDVRTEAPPTWLIPRDAISSPIRLGVNWDPEQLRRNVVAISQVNQNSPAAIAGLRAGDRILQFGPWQNGTFEDLKTTIQVVKNPVIIRIERPGSESPIEITANLQGNPVRLGAGWIEDSSLPNCVVVTHIVAESPADRAGIASGDVIMELGGRAITNSEELRQRILVETGPFRFRVERQGRIREVTVDPLDGSPPR
jgi:hypothetical protein